MSNLYGGNMEDKFLNYSHSKIQYLIYATNKKRMQLILIYDFLRAKKNMSYEQWSTLHYLIDKIQYYICENEKEIRRLCGYD